MQRAPWSMSFTPMTSSRRAQRSHEGGLHRAASRVASDYTHPGPNPSHDNR